ncbi:MAG: radical SAM protein [Rhodobacteraceae bacterium]|nr:radical SAM protein [Paracoccaceae bacterium]
MNDRNFSRFKARPPGKFEHPDITAKGEQRAVVPLVAATTLWFNTGTLCNIQCMNCYIESSPRNDSLAYITVDDVVTYLNQIEERGWPTKEIGFTGGEPYMNPQMNAMTGACLERGYDVLVLTNAMRPMMRAQVREGLLAIRDAWPGKLTLRVSVDHYLAEKHDQERGTGSFNSTLQGMRWLRDNGFRLAVAGRTMWGETEQQGRAGYAAFFARHGFEIDACNPAETVLFPEMDAQAEVPEITAACWNILDRKPSEVMCASSRMVVKRKGAERPAVVTCTLLPYDPRFEMGETLAEAEGPVKLNHPHCAKFCVLGGASCSA